MRVSLVETTLPICLQDPSNDSSIMVITFLLATLITAGLRIG